MIVVPCFSIGYWTLEGKTLRMIELQWKGMLIRLSLLFPAMIVVMLAMDTTGLSGWCIAASAMHETGHFMALLTLSSRPACVTVGIFGIRVEQNAHTPLSYKKNILVSLAGPMVNCVTCILLCAFGGLSEAAWVHGVLGIFNLLPIEPLDGGQALFCFLADIWTEEKAERLVLLISVITILPLAAAGFYVLIYSGYNITLLLLSLYLCLLILLKRKH